MSHEEQIDPKKNHLDEAATLAPLETALDSSASTTGPSAQPAKRKGRAKKATPGKDHPVPMADPTDIEAGGQSAVGAEAPPIEIELAAPGGAPTKAPPASEEATTTTEVSDVDSLLIEAGVMLPAATPVGSPVSEPPIDVDATPNDGAAVVVVEDAPLDTIWNRLREAEARCAHTMAAAMLAFAADLLAGKRAYEAATGTGHGHRNPEHVAPFTEVAAQELNRSVSWVQKIARLGQRFEEDVEARQAVEQFGDVSLRLLFELADETDLGRRHLALEAYREGGATAAREVLDDGEAGDEGGTLGHGQESTADDNAGAAPSHTTANGVGAMHGDQGEDDHANGSSHAIDADDDDGADDDADGDGDDDTEDDADGDQEDDEGHEDTGAAASASAEVRETTFDMQVGAVTWTTTRMRRGTVHVRVLSVEERDGGQWATVQLTDERDW